MSAGVEGVYLRCQIDMPQRVGTHSRHAREAVQNVRAVDERACPALDAKARAERADFLSRKRNLHPRIIS